MRAWRNMIAVVVAIAVLWSGAALAQTKPPECDPSRVPPKVEGQVVKVDGANGLVTVRADDGTTHEFQVAKKTLKEFKAGDRVEARLRTSPNC